MEISGKKVTVHLSTPLMAVNGKSVSTVKGKVIEKLTDGVLIQVESVEPKADSKFAYGTIFIPTHKIDFIGVNA